MKKKTLKDRAINFASNHALFPSVLFAALEYAWLAGYRAGQRDAKKSKTEE